MSQLAERIQAVTLRIRRACEACGRDPREVELLPVSKRQPLALIREAASLGFTRFGENYVQEGTQKALEAPELRFLLLGPLQRNKAKAALVHFQEILTVDRPELASRLRRLAEEESLVRKVWLQIDLWSEATKVGGCGPAEAEAVREALAGDPRLPIEGFMAIPPPEDRGSFQSLARFRRECEQKWGQKLRLSMGMSGDLEDAIAAGSDQVRIGTAFFGAR
jgi:pyridoxal phosphate enzyme (YggS family)